MGSKWSWRRIRRPGERRQYGGTLSMTVVVDERTLTKVIKYTAPCCGCRFYSTYGDPPRICPECGGVLEVPTALTPDKVVEQAPTLQQKVSRYVS
jgi:hypothetical protein